MSRRLRHISVVVGIIAVVLVALTLTFRYMMHTSSTGDVHVGGPKGPTTHTLPAAAVPVDVQTAYFTTQLPPKFVVKHQAETPADALSLLQLTANTDSITDQQFAASVGTVPAGGLSENGDYNLRATRTDTYKTVNLPGLPAGATAFQTISGPLSYVVFWPHGGRYAELAFSTDGNATPDQLQATYSQVIANWSWR